MKRRLVAMIAVAVLAGTGRAASADLTRVKVLKNNCNLRAKALVTSEVVGQVSENDILMAKTMDNDWVEVVPPTNIDLWVFGDYIADGKINCRQQVNVRAGAGINFSIVGQLSPGDMVAVRGLHTDWVKIAPPPACSLWIARPLVTTATIAEVAPAKLEQAQAKPAVPRLPAPPPRGVTSMPMQVSAGAGSPPTQPGRAAGRTAPAAPPVAPPAAKPAQADVFFTPAGLALAPAQEQGRWREVEGVLRAKNFIFRAPSDFRLVTVGDETNTRTICFVQGNEAQLKALLYRHVVVSGRQYWVKHAKYPVIIPERIVLK